jgi:hypothetical protein
MGFSEEGQLYSYDSEGVFRGLSFRNYQWMPVLDFKFRMPNSYSQLWVVGVCEGEVLGLEMMKGHDAPQYP